VNTAPVLFIGPAADNQPWIEVIADLIDPNVAEVFDAMMLRSGLITRLGLDALVDPGLRPSAGMIIERSNRHGQVPNH
jgi:hypothetical protein